MTMDSRERLTAAMRLIHAATGEPYGDGMTVTDIGQGYAERGDTETPWVLGDWNDRDRYDAVTGTRVTTSTVPSRLLAALERLGVECEWSDEWQRCSHCQRAVRSQPDSYSWRPFYVDLPDGDTLCGECALTPDWQNEIMATYVNDANRVITWCDESHLVAQGWTRANERQWENGLHPGMDASPATILTSIREATPGVDVVFWLDESSQFYIGFSAFTRPSVADDQDDDL